MLYIVLVLVLAALALLVTALITATSLWAWVSIGLSVLAGLILLVDWLRRRNRPEPGEAKPNPEDEAGEKAAKVENFDAEQTALLPSRGELGNPADVPEPEIEPAPEAEAETVPAPQPSEAAADGDATEATAAATADATTANAATANAATAGTATAATANAATANEKAPPVRDTPPAEENTSAEDLAVVKELEDEVVVVDEYPRYHLVDCPWLSGRDPIPIGVGEARQLGFTPCARCGPDAVLAAAHR
ncbi:hypothetical protein QRX50_25630 [Amycolatopsis carbonis]|uniref:Uncharacterized protein n=1 Tax=Amycolatopsis carbonis TaxID=715471 RepID=A0A9Y2MRI5_9PSEU|nr:hypothetical protein [Amycolatopsis sp. 2-15]WIX74948.1 hypothetical protein QRX50_25630 [Amycolatopsis sp. 2-15]